MIKLAFYKAVNDNWLGKLQAIWTGGAYSHVEVVLSDGRCASASSEAGGVVYRNLIINNIYDIVELTATEQDEKNIIDFIDSELGTKYDYYGVVRFVIPFLNPSANKWFCSEFAATAISFIEKYKRLGERAYKFSPNRLYHKLKEINT